jgi:hypothetical protein
MVSIVKWVVKTANNTIVAGIIMLLKKFFCNINIPKANSIPIRILEKYGAKLSENPIGYNCFTSNVDIAK